MPISLYISSNNFLEQEKIKKIKKSANGANRLVVQEEISDNIYAVTTHTKHCALGKNRLYVDDKVIAVFGGLFVDEENLPWHKIIEALEHEKHDIFTSFNAQFSVIIYFKKSRKTFWVSDRFSQYPLYYTTKNNELLISSSLSTFFECLESKKFNEKWLYDYIFFNLPLDTTSPIIDVHRMPAASVFCLEENNIKITTYASPFSAEIPHQSDKKSKEEAFELFKERFPKYYTILSGGKYSSAITAGYDARISALFAPKNLDFELYTYGMPSCLDILEGRKMAQSLELKHHELAFTDDVVKDLEYMANQSNTIGGGNLNILRATLQWLYEKLSDIDIEVASGGIVGDHFFRSDGTPGGNLSICATKLFENIDYNIQTNPFFSVFSNKKRAEDYFVESRDSLFLRLDWQNTSLGERHLNYAMYELSPKYYGAEYELAEHYLNLVSPYWDTKVRELAYKTTLSSMTMNAKLHSSKFPYWRANSMFAYILNQDSAFKKLPILGVSPIFLASGNKQVIQFGKVLQKSIPTVMKKVFSKQEDPQENWPLWFNKYLLGATLNHSPKLRISEYINSETLGKILSTETVKTTNEENTFIGGKLLTAELMLSKF